MEGRSRWGNPNHPAPARPGAAIHRKAGLSLERQHPPLSVPHCSRRRRVYYPGSFLASRRSEAPQIREKFADLKESVNWFSR
jgi:hypothetical protein